MEERNSIMGNAVIWFLIKFFERETHANEFIAGRLYMNTLGYFKELENRPDDGRADPSEAVWAWLQPGGIEMTITPTGFDPIKILESDLAAPISMSYKWHESLNVFCMYAIHSGAIKENCARELYERNECRIDLNVERANLGRFAVIVSAGPFLNKLRTALMELGYRANAKLVTYFDEESFHGEVPPEEVPFWKRRRFSHQQEFRICVHPPTANGQPLAVEIGDLSSYCRKLSSSEFPTQLLLKRS